jgi:N-acetylglutamate synthase-like GNAT family acetyltransferase
MTDSTDDLDSLVLHADTEPLVRQCWSVFKELRPHLTEDEFMRRWRSQITEGYRIIYIAQADKIVAAAGFRPMTTLAWGKILYLDDLVAAEMDRGRGWGTVLLRWLQKTARQNGVDAVHLDTGYLRYAAHKAYLRNGFCLNCHHLAWEIEKP